MLQPKPEPQGGGAGRGHAHVASQDGGRVRWKLLRRVRSVVQRRRRTHQRRAPQHPHQPGRVDQRPPHQRDIHPTSITHPAQLQGLCRNPRHTRGTRAGERQGRHPPRVSDVLYREVRDDARVLPLQRTRPPVPAGSHRGHEATPPTRSRGRKVQHAPGGEADGAAEREGGRGRGGAGVQLQPVLQVCARVLGCVDGTAQGSPQHAPVVSELECRWERLAVAARGIEPRTSRSIRVYDFLS
mmetsp:Transcript_18318/g.42296  ORF Transcript_18318/g.42296 Transcript_18318/m.42296 type:complete len:241 (+) Transcript_18318:1333-2055(+)